MKLSFSTKDVKKPSFQSLCRIASEYGVDGFEIYDALSERKEHKDSVLRTDGLSASKSMLSTHSLEVSALTYPTPLDKEEADENTLLQYIDIASVSGIENIIVSLSSLVEPSVLVEKYKKAAEKAVKEGVSILFETKGVLSKTSSLLPYFSAFASASLGAAWNTRETFFSSSESAETTIKTLGAYIRYVRLGDSDGEKSVLVGEGKLPVSQFLGALKSLNYEGFITVDWNEEVTDPDIVLTHCFFYG